MKRTMLGMILACVVLPSSEGIRGAENSRPKECLTESIWKYNCGKQNKVVLSKGKPRKKVTYCSEHAKCKFCPECKKEVKASAAKAERPPQKESSKQLEVEEVAEQECTDSNSWKLKQTEVEIARGAHGFIVKISKPDEFQPASGNEYPAYAIKRGFSKTDKLDIQKERNIMAAANKICPGYGVMEVSEPEPCISDHSGKGLRKFKYAMITPLMAGGDLDKWLQQTPASTKTACALTVAVQLLNGLKCLHESNNIHGDFKPDNVFIGPVDEKGCPTDVRVADFGLSTPVNHMEDVYPDEFLWISGHLSESMFYGGKDYYGDGGGDSLGIMDGSGIQYKSTPAIDWCSFMDMMYADFGMTAKQLFQVITLNQLYQFWLEENNGLKDLSVFRACGRYGQERERYVPDRHGLGCTLIKFVRRWVAKVERSHCL